MRSEYGGGGVERGRVLCKKKDRKRETHSEKQFKRRIREKERDTRMGQEMTECGGVCIWVREGWLHMLLEENDDSY